MSLGEFWEGGYFLMSPISLSSGIIFRLEYYMLRCNEIHQINTGRFLLCDIETENTID